MTEHTSEAATPAALHIEHYGNSGPGLVLAHGFGGSARNFRPQARVLRERFRVALYDARGHARSPAPTAEAAYTLGSLVNDLKHVASSIAATTVCVGGLSLGAMTALLYALEQPLAVDKLVLAALPPGSGTSADSVGRQKRQWALDFADCIEAEGLLRAGERFVWGESSRFDPQGAALIRQGFMEHAPHALMQLLRSALAAFPSLETLASSLQSLNLPTLIVVGSEDRECLASCQRAAELIPRAQLVVIPGAGHVVNLAKPDAFNRALLEFLE